MLTDGLTDGHTTENMRSENIRFHPTLAKTICFLSYLFDLIYLVK